MIGKVHAIAGSLALLLVLLFWVATAVSELSLSRTAIAGVKATILWLMLALIPSLIVAGGTGLRLARHRRSAWVDTKVRHMRMIAANGLLVPLPAAFYLRHKSAMGSFDGVFLAVQLIELLAGATNIVLLSLNLRDGLRIRRSRPMSHASGSRL